VGTDEARRYVGAVWTHLKVASVILEILQSGPILVYSCNTIASDGDPISRCHAIIFFIMRRWDAVLPIVLFPKTMG
jgi:hypothetical protein